MTLQEITSNGFTFEAFMNKDFNVNKAGCHYSTIFVMLCAHHLCIIVNQNVYSFVCHPKLLIYNICSVSCCAMSCIL